MYERRGCTDQKCAVFDAILKDDGRSIGYEENNSVPFFVEGIDLYGGTRHSSAIALREHFSPEQIKKGTMHQTNKAFERYFRVGADDIRDIYKKTNHKQSQSSKTTVLHDHNGKR